MIATVCVDLVLISIDLSKSYPATIYFLSFMLSQGAAIGAWLAVGKPFRLLRGAVFLAILLTLIWFTYLQYSIVEPENCWGRMVAVFSLHSVGSFLTTLLGLLLLGSFTSKTEYKLSELRFSLIEIFGWTIVVAICCMIMRTANYIMILKTPELWFFHLTSAFVIGAWSAFLLRSFRIGFGRYLSAVIVFLTYYLLGFYFIRYFSSWVQGVWIYQLYSALWLLVQRMDHVRKMQVVVKD